MRSDKSTSEQVIEGYKRHKLVRSAWCHAHQLMAEFESGRALDQRLAQFGLIIILGLLGISTCFLLGLDRLVLF